MRRAAASWHWLLTPLCVLKCTLASPATHWRITHTRGCSAGSCGTMRRSLEIARHTRLDLCRGNCQPLLLCIADTGRRCRPASAAGCCQVHGSSSHKSANMCIKLCRDLMVRITLQVTVCTLQKGCHLIGDLAKVNESPALAPIRNCCWSSVMWWHVFFGTKDCLETKYILLRPDNAVCSELPGVRDAH